MSIEYSPHIWLAIAPDRIEPDKTDWRQIESHNKQLLCRALASQTTIAFTGAGASLAYGLPLWGEMYQRMFDGLQENVASRYPTLAKPLKRLADLNSRDEHRKAEAKKACVPPEIELQSAFQILESAAHYNDVPPEQSISPALRRQKFIRVLSDAFGEPKSLDSTDDPYLSLLELPIRRFVTTNYDQELEKAIAKARGADSSRSFTQRDQSKMPRFSIALAPNNHYMVFHCHGTLASLGSLDRNTDQAPDDIVITENDYKYWYLSENPNAAGFRQLLDVILLSSPILFIGYSLGDGDLLRALRLFSLNREHSRHNSNVFALMRLGSADSSELQYRALQDRYGINIIGVEIKKPEDIRTRLVELKQTYLRERLEWRMQPQGRRLKPDPVRYRLQPQADQDPLFAVKHFEDDAVFGLLQEFLKCTDRNILVLEGDVGAGKYVRVSQILHARSSGQYQHLASFEYVFFSAHDTDDLYLYLKKIVLAAEHIAFGRTPSGVQSKGLIERLKDAFKVKSDPAKRICVVIAGLDRFIHWDHQKGEARRPNKLTKELLDLLKSVPADLGDGKVIVTTKFKLTREPDNCSAAATALTPEYANSLARRFEIDEEVPKILRMVNSHHSSFVLALAWLTSIPKEDRSLALEDMVDRLAGAVSERSSRLVRFVLRRLAPIFFGECGSVELLEKLLIFLSCFTRPFTSAVFERTCLYVCPNVGSEEILNQLTSFRLLEIVNPIEDGALYVVAPIVRQYCRTRRLGTTVVEVRAFGLHGYTSRGNFVDSGSSTIPGEFYAELTRQAKQEIVAFKRRWSEAAVESREAEWGYVARGLTRASFDILRSNFACNSAPRWGTFGSYVRMCAECFDLVKNYCIVSDDCWSPDSGVSTCVGDVGPLTAEEIVWLLNELGLAYYGEGAVQEAVGVWGLAFEWQESLRQIDPDQADMYSASLLCHLGAANLQIGRLDVAQGHFEKALLYARASENDDLIVRVRGFLARIEHFRGSVRRADAEYRVVLRKLERSGNKRAQSYFLRHRAALHIRQGNFSRAERLIRYSLVLAAAENYPDFVAYSRELLARLMVTKGRTEDAAREYQATLKEARRMGMYRLEADALLGLARVQLELGDATVARRRAMESLRIANQYVLALRQDRALLVLGKAQLRLGEQESGRQFLTLARDLASSHEFRLIQHEAEEELSKSGGGDSGSG